MIETIIAKLNWRKNIIISGGAGVGKSYTLNRLVSSGKLGRVQVLAPTALAAVAVGGRTVHSFFHFKRASNLSELRMKSEDKAELISALSELDVLIIDEISMLSASLFDMIDHFLSILERPPSLLFVGDFYQLAPISKDKNKPAEYAFCSQNWAKYDFELLMLETQHRMSDFRFYSELSKLRIGQSDASTTEFFSQFQTAQELSAFSEYTIICGTNKEAQDINTTRLHDHPGKLLKTTAKCKCNNAKEPSEQQLRYMINQTPLDEELYFKVGSRVIITMNAASCGVYNGMQAVISDVDANEGCVILQTKDETRIKLRASAFGFDANFEAVDSSANAEPAYVVYGFTFKLAYAITIHKSQGMSIDRLVCKCDKIFATGQLYVALSRASNPATFAISYQGSAAAFKNMLVQKTRIDPRVQEFYRSAKLFDENSIL